MAEVIKARVAVSSLPYAADKLYTYLIPDELCESAVPGVRVSIPFGRGNRRSEGFIFEIERGEAEEKEKYLSSVLDDGPLMDASLLKLCRFMKARYFCTYYDAIKTVLPGGLWLSRSEIYQLCSNADIEQLLADVKVGSCEESIIKLICENGSCKSEALYAIGGKDTLKILTELAERGIVYREEKIRRKINDKTERLVSLAISAEDALAQVEKKKTSAPVRYAVVELLGREGTLSASELMYFTGATMQTLKGLERNGIIAFSEREVLRISSFDVPNSLPKPIVLNGEQQTAFDGIFALMQKGSAAALLHGVTASGKTQVYIRLIEETIRLGKTALLLVPEIALTPQMLKKFVSYFGNDVALLHSALKLSERYDQWKRIRRGEVKVVLGTRSAVFAPLQNLGLIIMDEEQEPTYTSENPPRYQTSDIAQYRCAQSNALLLLGSATPTVETAYYAKQGRYQVFYLHRRYNEMTLPKVLIADMREELRHGNDRTISSILYEEIRENISCGEQSILFLNRRGSARMLLCGECGFVPECPRCSVPMTYHSANGRLMCHYCGHSERAEKSCPKCGGRMRHIGSGTQKVEQELNELFPNVPVLRMDMDTVGAVNGHEKILTEFENKKIPILLGTQMVAKGLDFENVTLVGVLSADQSLYIDNYHASERTFSLLSQVVGRAGRGSKQGRAVIQTYTPENAVLLAAAKQDYDAFYDSEVRIRSLRRYPPFSDLFTLTVSGTDENHVLKAATALRDGLRSYAEREDMKSFALEILGPASAPIVKVNNRYRYRVYIVGKNCGMTRKMVDLFLRSFYAHKENRGLDIFADCNALQ